MRNLKRALSLALASVMLLGMMVVGTSAASYPDVDAADKLEAIEVLKAVGVMTGDENGNFNPDNKVTRNEMAVVMCNLLGLTPGGTTPFADVPAWAQGYVAACYNNGIIAGTSATTFGGSDNVTAVQAGLMVMKALGYFGYQGEFGDDWKLAVVKQAAKIDLYDGINAYTDKDMTRNDVAQMVLNALECTVVVAEQIGGINVEGNGIAVTEKPTYNYTPADDRAGHNYAGAEATPTLQLCEKLYGSDLRKNGAAFDDFGRPAQQWTYHTKTIKTVKNPTLTYTKEVKIKDIYADLGKPSNAFVEDTSAANGADGYIVIDGQQGQQDNSSATITTLSGNSNEVGGQGTLTEVYYNKNTGEINIICVNTYLVQASGDYNEKTEDLAIVDYTSVALPTTLKAEDFDVKGYKDEDFILVTAVYGTPSYTIKSVAPATVVEDVKVSAYKASDYVTAGGTKYSYNDVALADAGNALNPNSEITGSYSLQSTTYDVVLDNYGYAIGVQPHSGEINVGDYVYIQDVSKPGFDVLAKAVFMDGTTKTITVSKAATYGGTLETAALESDPTAAAAAPSADGKVTKGAFYTYKVNKSGTYDLTAVEHPTYDASTTISDTNVAPVVAQTTLIGTSKTVFVAKDEVFTGIKNAPSVTTPGIVATVSDDNGYLIAVYAEKAGVSNTDADELVYIYNYATPASAKDEDDNTYFVYDAVVAGEKTTINVNGNSTIIADGLYEIKKYDNDGYVDDATLVQATDSAPYAVKTVDASGLAYNNGVLTTTVSTVASSYILADDVAIYVFDTTDNNSVKTVSAGYIKNLTIAGGDDKVYMAQVSSTNTNIAVIYIEIH